MGNEEPAQLKDARHYFDRMNARYGVRSVCGNSLGGALANAVGMRHPKVKTVTLDPAVMPGDEVDQKNNYPNITNFFTKYDGLTLGEEGVGYKDRFPGKIIRINSGVPLFANAFATNHLGYDGNENENAQYITVGRKGQPSYGRIDIGADDHLVTDIWTGQPIDENTHSSHIVINRARLDQLSDAIEIQVLSRLSKAGEYTQNANKIVNKVLQERAKRLSLLA